MITFALVAVLGVAGLLIAGSADKRSSAFSLDVPPAGPVATLEPGQPVCQGPIDTTVGFGSVTPWISPITATGPDLEMDVRSLDGATLATGSIRGGYRQPFFSPSFPLSASVPAGSRIDVCLIDRGTEPVTVLGAAAGNVLAESEAGDMSPGGGSAHLLMALLFTRPHPKSLLSLLPTVFSRASLFRPGWVGVWTFWVLAAGLLAAFVAGGIAVSQAVRADHP